MINIITGTNELKSLTKHRSCECKSRFDGKNVIQISDRIMINVGVNVKNLAYVKMTPLESFYMSL